MNGLNVPIVPRNLGKKLKLPQIPPKSSGIFLKSKKTFLYIHVKKCSVKKCKKYES